MKESTRHRDEPILRLIRSGRYTAKEIATIMNQDGRPRTAFISATLVYHVAYRSRLGLRSGNDRRSEARPLNPGRRATDEVEGL